MNCNILSTIIKYNKKQKVKISFLVTNRTYYSGIELKPHLDILDVIVVCSHSVRNKSESLPNNNSNTNTTTDTSKCKKGYNFTSLAA